jgi:hypothetical protein
MEFSFPWPMSQGEWLAWTSAVVTAALGLLLFLAPGIGFRLLRLQPHPDKPEAVIEGRSRFAGFYLGVGLCAILLAQPLLYNWAALAVDLALAALPLAFAFGFVP